MEYILRTYYSVNSGQLYLYKLYSVPENLIISGPCVFVEEQPHSLAKEVLQSNPHRSGKERGEPECCH